MAIQTTVLSVVPCWRARDGNTNYSTFRCAMLASQGWQYKLQYFPLCHAGEPRIIIQTTVLSVVPCWRAKDSNTNYSTFRCAMLASQGWQYKLQYFPLCHAGEPRIVIQTTVLSVVPCWRARDGNTNYSTFRCAMLASQGWQYKLQYFPLCHAGEPGMAIQTTVLL